MTGNEVAGPYDWDGEQANEVPVFTEYEVEAQKDADRRADQAVEEMYLARIEGKLDVLAAIQSVYSTDYRNTYAGAAPREVRVETPEGPRYRRLDKVAPEDHLDGRKMTRYVAQDENGGQVLVEVYWKREDHPVGYGAFVIDRMTLAFRGGPLESWGPPSQAREA